ncbi:MAG: NAD-dependent epimerase/dehydratase family protein [Proteobacteria bacterium]|nr:NAD-dependent epimerase/dehydratase family protein [Pseudomonadota bacterium]
MKCLVTGAGGFIGAHLVRYLLDAGHEVRAVGAISAQAHTFLPLPPRGGGRPEGAGEGERRSFSPSPPAPLPQGERGAKPAKNIADEKLENVQVTRSAANPADWQEACRDVEVVFHLAGRAHRGDNSSPSARSIYFRDNLEMTRALAEAALNARVRRFVFASSVAVYGAASVAGEAFREDSPVAPHPDNVYAQSKRAAEEILLSDGAALEPVVVRFPLVYGAGVKGNMATLMRLAASGLPLPLAGIDNRRSFINIPNCVDFLLTAACHPNAGGRILLATDREDVTTPDLIRAIAREFGKTGGKPARLFSVPPRFLRAMCSLLGQRARFEKLAGSFQIDPAASCALLGWSPKVSLAEGIAQMCAEHKCARGAGGRDALCGVQTM